VSLRFVLYAVGKLCIVLAAIMLVPAAIAVAECLPLTPRAAFFNPRLVGFWVGIVGAFMCGAVLVLAGRKSAGGNSAREGFAIVTFSWIILTFFSSFPLFVYFLANEPWVDPARVLRCFTNAYFEIMSGYTTTGATILTDIEALPKGILFWRSMTHWLGGMGIVTLALAIFPAFGVAGYQMFRGELPGPTKERLRPRLAQTAKILWGVYALLTAAETALLYIGGMSLFDSLCHAFGTMATGGFSTRNASIGAYTSAYVDWVVIIFMFFAGINFMIHYRVLFNGKFNVLSTDPEFRFYILVVSAAVCVTVTVLSIGGLAGKESVARSFRPTAISDTQLDARMNAEAAKVAPTGGMIRHAVFQVVSITTTTGFCTADFDMWPDVLRLMLVALMFFGGCAGSTGGGMKMIRIMVVLKAAWRHVKTTVQPRLVAPIKISGTLIEEKLVHTITGFFLLFILLFAFFSLVMSCIVPDFTTAITSVAATMCNIGPGLSGIGPTETYAWIPLSGKWVLIICMLLGRLEVFTVLIAFAPISWRK